MREGPELKKMEIGYIQSKRKIIRIENKMGWYADIYLENGEFVDCMVVFGRRERQTISDFSDLSREEWEFLGKVSMCIQEV